MAVLKGRQSVQLFTGGIDIAFGIVFILMGVNSVLLFNHGAVGVAMWCGIGFIMIGIGNVIAVLTSTTSKKRAPDYLSINFGSLVLNLTGMLMAACVIGFYTWGAWDVLQVGPTSGVYAGVVTYDDLISIFSTVVLMAIIVFAMSLVVMFMDCCSFALFGGAGAGDYGPPRDRQSMPDRHSMHDRDGPYGMPPSYMHRQ